MSNALAAVALGVVVLFGAYAVPTLIAADDGRPNASVDLEAGESTALGSQVKITAVSTSTTDATLAVTNPRTGNTSELSFQSVDTPKNATVDGFNVTVTVESLGSTATVATVEYNATMGFSSEGRALFGETDVLLVLGFGVFCLAAVFKVIS